MLKDNRMREIYASVRKMSDKGVCDVGTDHAHIPIELVKNGIVPFAVATDISAPSIKKGELNIARLGLSNKIKTFCANGTLNVPLDGIGDIIIAGMGGELIAEIIFADKRLKDPNIHFVLQPMTKHEILRSALSENGYSIENESCISDGERIYFIMSVYYSGIKKELSVKEKLLGVNTHKTSELIEYAKRVYVQLTSKLKGLESAISPNETEIALIKNKLSILDSFINE